MGLPHLTMLVVGLVVWKSFMMESGGLYVEMVLIMPVLILSASNWDTTEPLNMGLSAVCLESECIVLFVYDDLTYKVQQITINTS